MRTSDDPQPAPSRGPAARLVAVAVGGLALLVSGCGRDAGETSVPLGAKGPPIRIRVVDDAAAVTLALPSSVRLRHPETAEVWYEGDLARDTGGIVRVRAAGDSGGLAVGTVETEGPVEVQLLTPEDLIGTAVESKEVGFLGIGAEDSAAPSPCATSREVARFRGSLIIEARGGRLRVTNRLSLEEYLAGVLGGEMRPAADPLAALKAQAVAARTYALYALREAESRGNAPVFDRGPAFQVYDGMAKEHPNALRAVSETCGEILTYNGGVFRTYFHSTCGGQTADAGDFFDEPDIPPLRSVVCGACTASKYFRWSVPWSDAEIRHVLEDWLAERDGELGPVEAIEVSERGPDDRVRYVRFKHSLGSLELQAARLRSLSFSLGRLALKSTWFDVLPRENGFVFEGRGWGHGVGLCQMGAAELGRSRSYREILSHYYPAAEIQRLY